MEFKKFVVATMGVAMAVCANAESDSHLSGVKVYTDGLNNRTNLEVKKSVSPDEGITVSANGYNDYTGLNLYARTFTMHGFQNWVPFQITANGKIGIGSEVDKDFDLKMGGSTLLNGDFTVLFPKDPSAKFQLFSNEGVISLVANTTATRGSYLSKMNLTATSVDVNGNMSVSQNMTVDGKITCHSEIEVTKMTAANVNVNELNAKDIKVELNNAADYVFEENYNLKSLNEVESYVKANKHLPGVPSAAEIAKNGMSVSEMSNLFLEKIEELTLHMIQLQKENEALKAEVESLKK